MRTGGACRTNAAGFSFIELLIVVTIVGILATGALGLTRWEHKRTAEIELQRALREIRSAIDAHHEAVESGLIESEPDERGYPPDLASLVEGVELVDTGDDDEPRLMKFLRRIPIDPMTGNTDWGLRSYQDAPDARFWGRENVYDVYSKSARTAIDGSLYRDW
jgi:general secretion pathway protein G